MSETQLQSSSPSSQRCQDITLEIFGQQSSAALQTPFILFYSSPSDLDINPILAKLKDGAQTLSNAFPWMAGNIIQDPQGVWKIRVTRDSPTIIVKDHREDDKIPSFETMEREDFAISYVDEDWWCPVTVLPSSREEGREEGDRTAILTIQLNLVKGGIVLAILGHHQAMDGTGQEQMLYLLNKACNNQPFTEEVLRIGNMARKDIVQPFGDEWEPQSDSIYLPSTSSANPLPPPSTPGETEDAELIWANFSFTSSSLISAKIEASQGISGFVSTDDVLTSLIWRSISTARLSRFPPSTPSTLARAINPRRYLSLPPTYPGYITNMAFSTLTLSSLSTLPLSSIAFLLRSAVNPITSHLGESTRELATLIHRAIDKDSISITQNLNLDKDLMFSSWANMRCYQFDFGSGREVKAFRRAKHGPVSSLGFSLPKDGKGEMTVSLCARRDDLERMKADGVLGRYGRFVG